LSLVTIGSVYSYDNLTAIVHWKSSDMNDTVKTKKKKILNWNITSKKFMQPIIVTKGE